MCKYIQELRQTILTDGPSQERLVKGHRSMDGSGGGDGGEESCYDMLQMKEASRLREERRELFQTAR